MPEKADNSRQKICMRSQGTANVGKEQCVGALPREYSGRFFQTAGQVDDACPEVRKKKKEKNDAFGRVCRLFSWICFIILTLPVRLKFGFFTFLR